MESNIIVFILLILTVYIINKLLNWKRKKTYINAGEKWDKIVEELRKRQ